MNVLGAISLTGRMPLSELDVDDFMSLGGLGLIAVDDDGAVSITERGARLLALQAAPEPH